MLLKFSRASLSFAAACSALFCRAVAVYSSTCGSNCAASARPTVACALATALRLCSSRVSASRICNSLARTWRSAAAMLLWSDFSLATASR